MKGDLNKELIELAMQLIGYRTIEGEVTTQCSCLAFIREYLSGTRGVYYFDYTYMGQPYLIVGSKKTKEPDVLLSGHIDVVPGKDSQFVPVLKGRRLYGRGALDMKGGVAVIVKLFRDLLLDDKNREDLPSLALMLTSDEEIGGVGAKWLVQKQGWRTRFLLIPEGEERFRFVVREKGVCWVRMSVKGVSAHAAYPWRADNALLKLYGAYGKVSSLFKPAADRWQSSISLTGIEAEQTVRNQVPSWAKGVLDVRYTEDLADSAEEIVQKFRAVAPEARFELLGNGDRLSGEKGNPYLRHLRSIVSRQLKRRVQFGFNHGASDASAFAALAIPAMTSGITGACHHGDNEYVNVDSMVEYYKFAKEFIETFKQIKK